MAVADKQPWVLAKPKVSDNDNQVWVLGQAANVLDSAPVVGVIPIIMYHRLQIGVR